MLSCPSPTAEKLPRMKICVVTPYFKTEPAWVRQCHASVRAQTVPAHHILVCDGSEPAQIEGFKGTHVILQRNYKDYGNTPRLIGCYNAITLGADAIAFLDGDNWFQADHLENLLRFAAENSLDACSSSRLLYQPDGTFISKCQTVDGKAYIDTSCLLVMKPAFQHLISWALFPQDVAAVMDQHVWNHLGNSGARLGFLDKPTVCYRTRHASHYRLAGQTPPPDAIDRADLHGERYQ